MVTVMARWQSAGSACARSQVALLASPMKVSEKANLLDPESAGLRRPSWPDGVYGVGKSRRSPGSSSSSQFLARACAGKGLGLGRSQTGCERDHIDLRGTASLTPPPPNNASSDPPVIVSAGLFHQDPECQHRPCLGGGVPTRPGSIEGSSFLVMVFHVSFTNTHS